MASNETVAGIIAEVRTINPCNEYADRIEAAHNRELAAKDDERLTIVSMYENVIAAKDREIAELRRRLNIAEDALEKCVNYNNAWELEAAEENAKNALAAIREKGANNGK